MSAGANDKYSRCPDCGCKTVYFRMKINGEDNYSCRLSRCDFYFFTNSESRIDEENRARWEKANEEKKS